MLGDDGEDFFAQDRNQVRLTRPGAFMREQDLQAFAGLGGRMLLFEETQ
jgi:hypothetical protein